MERFSTFYEEIDNKKKKENTHLISFSQKVSRQQDSLKTDLIVQIIHLQDLKSLCHKLQVQFPVSGSQLEHALGCFRA